jgi:hypothetical protein
MPSPVAERGSMAVACWVPARVDPVIALSTE